MNVQIQIKMDDKRLQNIIDLEMLEKDHELAKQVYLLNLFTIEMSKFKLTLF